MSLLQGISLPDHLRNTLSGLCTLTSLSRIFVSYDIADLGRRKPFNEKSSGVVFVRHPCSPHSRIPALGPSQSPYIKQSHSPQNLGCGTLHPWLASSHCAIYIACFPASRKSTYLQSRFAHDSSFNPPTSSMSSREAGHEAICCQLSDLLARTFFERRPSGQDAKVWTTCRRNCEATPQPEPSSST